MKNKKTYININYGNGAFILPGAVLEYIDKVSKTDLALLMLISSGDEYRGKQAVTALSEALGCEEREVTDSLELWDSIGIISYLAPSTESKKKRISEPKTAEEETSHADVPRRVKLAEIPQYTTDELNALLKVHGGSVELIDECQNIIGKIFTAADIKVLMGLVDYLGLDNDYILVLMHFAAKNHQKSMRYIEKLAVSCLDDGFTDAVGLQAELYAREERREIENEIRNIFGLGTRKLTSKEQAQISVWIKEYKFDLDVIELAYDITVGATSKPSIHYANAILEGWYKDGARSLEDVNALQEKRKQESEADKNGNSSFNVDDFFDAAIKRSYAEV